MVLSKKYIEKIKRNNIKLTKKESVKIYKSLSIKLQNVDYFNKKYKTKLHNNINNYYETHIYKDHYKYINVVDIIYWINLDRSNDRRKNMEKILSNFKIENIRIKASDGKLETDDNIYGKFITDKLSISKLEYACLLSHLNTIKQFSESNYEIALILEDDVSLDFSIYWDKPLSEIINEVPKDWDIIMLGYLYNKPVRNLYTLNTMYNKFSSALSYIINKKSALKFINNIYKNDKYYLTTKFHHQADDLIYRMNTTYVYKYPYFINNNNNISTIGLCNNTFFNELKIKTLETWKNYILEKVNNNSKNVFLLNDNNNKNIINEKFIIVNLYGFYCNYIYKNKYLTKNYIIIKIHNQNVYIYYEKQFINKKKFFFIEKIYSKNNLIKKLNKVKELKFILDYIHKLP